MSKRRCTYNPLVMLLLTALMAFGCRKAYLPPIIASDNSYLVVEGLINTGQDSTIIRLTRTIPLSSGVSAKPETGADVSIVSSSGSSYELTETGNGYYAAPGLNLSTSDKYGLKITTDGKTYQSDLVEAKNSPPIDSLNYLVKSDGVTINVNTHDPANSSRYYRWDYIETYEFHTASSSSLILQTVPFDTLLLRTPEQEVYRCWRTDNSSTIVLGSSAKLSQDVISQNEVTTVASTSEKLEDVYSILVKQYVLTPDAYNYWQQLKKNTEQLGSIFDAQPSELPSNIHCTSNPAEPVIGYISAGSASEKRLYIDNRKLPAWKAVTPYDGCLMPENYFFEAPTSYGKTENDVDLYIYSGLVYALNPISTPGGQILGYTGTARDCADCTLRGTNIKPSFWQGN